MRLSVNRFIWISESQHLNGILQTSIIEYLFDNSIESKKDHKKIFYISLKISNL